MRVFIETAFSGILRGKLLSVESEGGFDYARVKITSRGSIWYGRSVSELFPLDNVTPADCFRVARQRGSGKLYLRCTQTHSRADLFRPYREGGLS